MAKHKPLIFEEWFETSDYDDHTFGDFTHWPVASFLLISESSAMGSFLLLSSLPWAFLVWMLSPLELLAVKLHSLQVFGSNWSGICCMFVGASGGAGALDGAVREDIFVGSSITFRQGFRLL